MGDKEKQTPQSKVFTTPELLEIILLRLDNRTLLVSAQRVCKTWSALIQSSPTIQQALFFQSAPKSKSEKVKAHAKSAWNSIVASSFKKEGSSNRDESIYPQPIYNPLLVHAFRPFFPSVEEHLAIYDSDGNQTKSASGTSPEAEERKSGDRFSFKPLDIFSSPEKKTAYMRKEASWRNMHLRQPPVHGYIAIFTILHAMGGDTYLAYKVCLPTAPFPTQQLKEG